MDKWKKTDLSIFEADTWLIYGVDKCEKGKFCYALKFTVFVKFEQAISKRHNFATSWIDGSVNFKLSNVIDHAKSEAHNEALALYKRRLGQTPPSPMLTGNQRPLEFKVTKEQEKVFRKKFDISYFVVKEEMPFIKYEKIIEQAWCSARLKTQQSYCSARDLIFSSWGAQGSVVKRHNQRKVL